MGSDWMRTATGKLVRGQAVPRATAAFSMGTGARDTPAMLARVLAGEPAFAPDRDGMLLGDGDGVAAVVLESASALLELAVAVLAMRVGSLPVNAGPAPLQGFALSAFSPLVAELAGVLLASRSGDIATATAIAQAVDGGRRVPPLLFYQSSPNAVDRAAAMVTDGDADAVLVIAAETGGDGVHGVSLLLGSESWEAE